MLSPLVVPVRIVRVVAIGEGRARDLVPAFPAHIVLCPPIPSACCCRCDDPSSRGLVPKQHAAILSEHPCRPRPGMFRDHRAGFVLRARHRGAREPGWLGGWLVGWCLIREPPHRPNTAAVLVPGRAAVRKDFLPRARRCCPGERKNSRATLLVASFSEKAEVHTNERRNERTRTSHQSTQSLTQSHTHTGRITIRRGLGASRPFRCRS